MGKGLSLGLGPVEPERGDRQRWEERWRIAAITWYIMERSLDLLSRQPDPAAVSDIIIITQSER